MVAFVMVLCLIRQARLSDIFHPALIEVRRYRTVEALIDSKIESIARLWPEVKRVRKAELHTLNELARTLPLDACKSFASE